VLLVSQSKKTVESFKQYLKQWLNLIVEQLEPTSTDTPEKRPQKDKVVDGFLGLGGEFDRVHDDVAKMGLEHNLVGIGEESDSHESQLEEPEDD
jgi:hypothetical protein